MGTSTVDYGLNLNVPVATVTSAATEITPKFLVDVGVYAAVNDVIEAQVSDAATNTWLDNEIIATQLAVLDQAGVQTGLLDWTGEPQLPDGNYKYRFRARRQNVPSDWSSDVLHTISGGNYGADVIAPVLSNLAVSVTADTTATITVDTDEDNGYLYTVISPYSTAPTAAQVIAGQVVNSSGTVFSAIFNSVQAVSATGEQEVSVSSLVKGTSYYAYLCHQDNAANESNIIGSEQFTQTDSTPPVVSGVASVATAATTATGQGTTSQPLGTIYWVVTTSATPPSKAHVKAGQNQAGADAGAGRKGFSAVTSAGTYTFNISSLTGGTTYYLYVMHEDELTQQSNVGASASWATPAAVDSTAPVLTSPTLTGTSDTTASGSVVTDEANGTYYWVITTSATKPTALQIRNGQNNAGTAAAASGSAAVTSTGIKTFNATGLTASTTYYAHFTHRDAAGNDATVVSSSSITTIATPSGGALGSSISTEFIGFTNSTTPEFLMVFNSVQVGDVIRLSWTGAATGNKDVTITSNMLDPAHGSFLQFSWNDGTLPTFAYGTYAFTIRQTRGGSSITGPTMNVTLAASGGSSSGGGSGGTVENPPPPAAETFYYLKEDNSPILMEDGVSYYLKESAP